MATVRIRWSASHRRRNEPKLIHEFRELAGEHRLRAIAECVIRVVMHFHQEPVGTRGNGGARHGRHQIAAAGGMGGIGYDRQVGKFFHHRYSRNVEGIARVSLKAANAALAENYFVIAAGKNIFGGKQKLFNGCRNAALQQYRLADAPQLAQQIIILHIARADLENIGISRQQRNLAGIHHLTDDQQPRLSAASRMSCRPSSPSP